jgi:hypothetical protein
LVTLVTKIFWCCLYGDQEISWCYHGYHGYQDLIGTLVTKKSLGVTIHASYHGY